VSTGTSLFPSWKTLLLYSADKLETESKEPYGNLVRSLLEIDPPDYMQAAQRAKTGLGNTWIDFLKNQFDHNVAEATNESLELARAIWNLGSKLIVTTNYDRVLRWTCPAPKDVALWSIQAPAEQVSAMRDGLTRPAIWHLHGQIDDAANIILTPDGYDRLYPSKAVENVFGAALETLRHLLATHSFLFIGFSLQDEAFGLQLRAVNDIFGSTTGPHYALLHNDSVEAVKAQNIPGIEPIPFNDFDSSLLNLVRALGVSPNTEQGKQRASEALVGEFSPPTNLPCTVEVLDEQSCDTPPSATAWVGRGHELEVLRCHRPQRLSS
tara:strand:- start:854 stop:1825 length:972 start_codon:yes stop_codon:yes gene_type:complete